MMFDKLKNWLTGDADYPAEKKLDKLAKNDPFLRDAMDGYRSMPEGEHAANIENLKDRLNQRKKKQRGIAWWRMAAAAMVIIGGTWLYFISVNNDSIRSDGDATVATTPIEETPEVEITVAVIPDEAAAIIADTIVEEAMVEIAIPEKAKPTTTPPKTNTNTTEELFAGTTDVIVDRPTPLDTIAITSKEKEIVATNTTEPALPETPAIITIEDTITEIVVSAEPIEAEQKTQAQQAQSTEPIATTVTPSINQEEFVLEGIIMDENGEGLIGANLIIEGTKIGTVTDVEGKFSLSSDHPMPWNVVANYIGYESQLVAVNDTKNELQIVLTDAGQLLESVVVSAQGKKRRSKKKKASASPQPKKGFKKYNRYIKKEMKYPEAARENGVEGIIIVVFYINADGQPENIRVSNSLGYGLDEEAIRLIGEGAKWKPVNREASFQIEFEL